MSPLIPQGDFVMLNLFQYLTLISKTKNITINRKAFSTVIINFKGFETLINIDLIKM